VKQTEAAAAAAAAAALCGYRNTRGSSIYQFLSDVLKIFSQG